MEVGDQVSYDLEESICWITMRDPSGGLVLMTIDIMKQLRLAFERASLDPDVRVVVLTAIGQGFMAGADLDFVRSGSVEGFREFARHNQALAAEMMACEKPIIAGINGHAIGGGAELALVCDIRLCAASAKLGFPEVTIGLLHSTASSFLLSRIVGLGRAKELVLTGRQISAAEALEIGLVSSVVPGPNLKAALLDMATLLAANSAPAMRWAKKIFDIGASSDAGSALAIEEIGNVACFDTPERKARAEEFFERRRDRQN